MRLKNDSDWKYKSSGNYTGVLTTRPNSFGSFDAAKTIYKFQMIYFQRINFACLIYTKQKFLKVWMLSATKKYLTILIIKKYPKYYFEFSCEQFFFLRNKFFSVNLIFFKFKS